jgi:hypothetical protein
MAIKLQQFFNARGFHANPFATTNAEQETDFLPSFFVRVPWFDQLVGHPQRPESLILFAPQGYGKTSHRIELGRHASDHETAALVVTLNDFSTLLDYGLDQVTIATYIAVIRQLFLEALDMQLQNSAKQLERFQGDAWRWSFFHALLCHYTPHRAIGRPTPPMLQEHMNALKQGTRGPKAWLKELAGLAHQAGFASVYVLLDGVDELYETKGNSRMMFRLIRPLLEAPGLLQECGFAFKFFLPQDLEDEMRQQQVGRLDRIPTFSLSWTPTQLCEMLSQRLIAYSLSNPTNTTAAVERFQDLCAAEANNVDLELACVADTSPRRMIDLAREIISEHCANHNDLDAPIGHATVRTVLKRRSPEYRHSAPVAVQNDVVVHVAPGDQVPLLCIDSHGDVWLGDVRLQTNLTPMLRRCLECLWSYRHSHVSYEDLQHALYGDSIAKRGDPQSSCEKLVRRLREYLEPGKPGSRLYIDVQAGFGFVLRNFCDT